MSGLTDWTEVGRGYGVLHRMGTEGRRDLVPEGADDEVGLLGQPHHLPLGLPDPAALHRPQPRRGAAREGPPVTSSAFGARRHAEAEQSSGGGSVVPALRHL